MRSTVIIIFFLMICISTEAQEQDEIFVITTTAWLDVYIKAKSITKPDPLKNEYQFLVKIYPNPDHIKECRKYMAEHLKDPKYMYFKFSETQWYVRCDSYEFANPNYLMYDINDELINENEKVATLDYQPVLVGSLTQTIFTTICEVGRRYLSK